MTKDAYEKLNALRKVANLLGMISPNKVLRPSREELDRRLNQYGIETLARALVVLADDQSTGVQKSAALCIVEYFWPDFKESADEQFIGPALAREDARVREWRKAVFDRDGWVCTKCGNKNELHAHHIARWVDAPHLRIVVDNGVTLCRECHEKEHHGSEAAKRERSEAG